MSIFRHLVACFIAQDFAFKGPDCVYSTRARSILGCLILGSPLGPRFPATLAATSSTTSWSTLYTPLHHELWSHWYLQPTQDRGIAALRLEILVSRSYQMSWCPALLKGHWSLHSVSILSGTWSPGFVLRQIFLESGPKFALFRMIWRSGELLGSGKYFAESMKRYLNHLSGLNSDCFKN